jgi:hypothetical protein
MEYELLKFLAQNPGKVFTREMLLSRVWGYEYYGGARTVDVHIRRLRAKLGEEHANLIQTVRSVGYRFGQSRWGADPTYGLKSLRLTTLPGAAVPESRTRGGRPGMHSTPAVNDPATVVLVAGDVVVGAVVEGAVVSGGRLSNSS